MGPLAAKLKAMVDARGGVRRRVFDPNAESRGKGTRPLMSEGYLSKLLKGYVPERWDNRLDALCAAFPEDAVEIILAWHSEQGARDRQAAVAAAQRIGEIATVEVSRALEPPSPDVREGLAPKAAAELVLITSLIRKSPSVAKSVRLVAEGLVRDALEGSVPARRVGP